LSMFIFNVKKKLYDNEIIYYLSNIILNNKLILLKLY